LIAAGAGWGEDRRRDGSMHMHHPWMKSSWCAAVKNIHIMTCIFETCTTRVMCVSCKSWGGYTASSYSALDRFVVHFQ
jgi:hypothetical protein